MHVDEERGIYYDDPEIQSQFNQWLSIRCPKCMKPFDSLDRLANHVRGAHHLHLCHLCLKNRPVFCHEQTCYTHTGLQDHMAGRHPEENFTGHPQCKFCGGKSFYDEEALREHMTKCHMRCEICHRNGRCDEYYPNYRELEKHSRQEHFPCEHPECRGLVFANEIDLKAHQLQTHSEGRGTRGIRLEGLFVMDTDRDEPPFHHAHHGHGHGHVRRMEHRDHYPREERGRPHGHHPHAHAQAHAPAPAQREWGFQQRERERERERESGGGRRQRAHRSPPPRRPDRPDHDAAVAAAAARAEADETTPGTADIRPGVPQRQWKWSSAEEEEEAAPVPMSVGESGGTETGGVVQPQQQQRYDEFVEKQLPGEITQVTTTAQPPSRSRPVSPSAAGTIFDDSDLPEIPPDEAPELTQENFPSLPGQPAPQQRTPVWLARPAPVTAKQRRRRQLQQQRDKQQRPSGPRPVIPARPPPGQRTLAQIASQGPPPGLGGIQPLRNKKQQPPADGEWISLGEAASRRRQEQQEKQRLLREQEREQERERIRLLEHKEQGESVKAVITSEAFPPLAPPKPGVGPPGFLPSQAPPQPPAQAPRRPVQQRTWEPHVEPPELEEERVEESEIHAPVAVPVPTPRDREVSAAQATAERDKKQRNERLVAQMKEILESEERFNFFRVLSSQFLHGKISADHYYDKFVVLFGVERLATLFEDLLWLLPNHERRTQLRAVRTRRIEAAAPGSVLSAAAPKGEPESWKIDWKSTNARPAAYSSNFPALPVSAPAPARPRMPPPPTSSRLHEPPILAPWARRVTSFKPSTKPSTKAARKAAPMPFATIAASAPQLPSEPESAALAMAAAFETDRSATPHEIGPKLSTAPAQPTAAPRRSGAFRAQKADFPSLTPAAPPRRQASWRPEPSRPVAPPAPKAKPRVLRSEDEFPALGGGAGAAKGRQSTWAPTQPRPATAEERAPALPPQQQHPAGRKGKNKNKNKGKKEKVVLFRMGL
eukprot:gnl/Trimastix_PCT/2213.p1 GENE.gnl/Trimastix_PCT/2213~~gnl/Trimastix_PCT/2213.p1  ORF type:complete len:1095 (+),score=218.07 gnl/Trimastix_PCT/2213:296-3286(+)